jgi:hypothetical protein
VLHPPVERGDEEEEGSAVCQQVVGEEWHHCGVLHPLGEHGKEEVEWPAAHRDCWEVALGGCGGRGTSTFHPLVFYGR